MRANAGGIDIGATEVFVAVPADRDSGDGIDQRVLDTAVSNPGSTWN